MIAHRAKGKIALAKAFDVSVSSLYYEKRLPKKDNELKIRIEESLRYHPSYGHRRLSIHLGVNRKRIRRVMKLFDLHPYRRRGRKPWKSYRMATRPRPNLAKGVTVSSEHYLWAADFTYLSYQGKFLYVATVIDVFTRTVVGWAVMRNHSTSLVLQALFMGLSSHPRPAIFHSDNGREYGSKVFTKVLAETGIRISRTAPASPRENGFQESFYSQFKIDLGDPDRCASLGELAHEIAKTIWTYNHTRIHLAIKMPPAIFAQRQRNLLEFHS